MQSLKVSLFFISHLFDIVCVCLSLSVSVFLCLLSLSVSFCLPVSLYLSVSLCHGLSLFVFFFFFFAVSLCLSICFCLSVCLSLCICVRGFLTRMVYLFYKSCLRYTILVGNPRCVSLYLSVSVVDILYLLYGVIVSMFHLCCFSLFSPPSSFLLIPPSVPPNSKLMLTIVFLYAILIGTGKPC